MKAERIAEIQADLKQSEKLLQPTPLESSMESAVRDLLADRTRIEWQPIETAPKDGRWILIYLPDPGPHLVPCGVVPVKWTGGFGGWTTRGVQGIDGATHWMPLPKEPDDKVAKEDSE